MTWDFTCHTRKPPANQEKFLFGRVAKFCTIDERGPSGRRHYASLRDTRRHPPSPNGKRRGEPTRREVPIPVSARFSRGKNFNRRTTPSASVCCGLETDCCSGLLHSGRLVEVLRTPTYQDRGMASGTLTFPSDAETDIALQPQ